MKGQITDVETLKAFIFAGEAIFTLVSKATGNRFTYRITRAPGKEEDRPWFVSLLRGPDNTDDFSYLGVVFPSHHLYCHGKKSKITDGAASVQGIRWFLSHLDRALDQVEVWHQGKCGRCGRPLTVPESISTGLGPVCAGLAS